MTYRRLEEASLAGARALVRVDFNVPMKDGEVSDDTRLRAALRTIRRLCEVGARVILLSHFDRPKGRPVASMSLAPVTAPLAALLGVPVTFCADCVGESADRAVAAMQPGEVLLLENLRFHPGEEANDAGFAAALAANGDLFVNDAFSAAHRAHASTEALAHLLPAYPGDSMRRELDALDSALGSPRRPVLGIVGGAKVSTKLDLLNNLIVRLDTLAIGGAMANTFLLAQGVDVGASLVEPDLVATATSIMAKSKDAGCELLLPVDAVTAQTLAPGVRTFDRNLDAIGADERILDAGPRTLARLIHAMENSRTLIWNGPLGVFEVPPFDAATSAAAQRAGALASAGALVAVAGGGDTVAALNHARVCDQFSFVSTAGGAFLEWMEGKTLPGVAALQV